MGRVSRGRDGGSSLSLDFGVAEDVHLAAMLGDGTDLTAAHGAHVSEYAPLDAFRFSHLSRGSHLVNEIEKKRKREREREGTNSASEDDGGDARDHHGHDGERHQPLAYRLCRLA